MTTQASDLLTKLAFRYDSQAFRLNEQCGVKSYEALRIDR